MPRGKWKSSLAGGMRIAIALVICAAVLGGVRVSLVTAQEPTPEARAAKKQKYQDFKEVTEDAKTYSGLFSLYEVDDHLYAELRPNHFNQMFLAPIAIARGMASAGTPLNFGDEWILSFRREGDRVLLIRNNVHYEAPKGSPLGRAVEQNYTDSVLMALPIVSINPSTQGVLIDFSSIFLSDFAGLGLGPMDRTRSSWHKVKAFENNVELEVEATFGSRMASASSSFGDDGVIDKRGITLIIHYSLAKRPESGYKPRFADQRVGHFISATKDFAKADPNTTFQRRINRWRLEKANSQAKLSPPTKQLVWWVEDTVPHEYRPYVEEGILEWNKAFEKIGFRNAIGVRWQNERDEFDPEDINYCTFRWITTPSTFAMSGLRADPITGEMIDGDVIFDASWIRAWKQEYAFAVGAPVAAGESPMVLDVAEVISPIMAARYGFGVPMSAQHRLMLNRQMGTAHLQHDHTHGDHGHAHLPELVPGDQSPLTMALRQRLASGQFTGCNFASARRHEYTLAAMAIAARNAEADGDSDEGKDESEQKEVKLPEELIGQAIKEVVMHEVGHSLGLRHNFKASSMLSLDEINDPELTRKKGMVGSVMDYNPLNVSRDGEKQGDYATTTIGPYDYWAIEYAYKPISGDEQKELNEIASRSPEPDLVYATDEDLYSSNDPLVNAYDLGNDNLRYAKDRIRLAQELMDDLDDTMIRDGESWVRLRQAFSVLLNQYGNGAYLAANYIGGQYFSRDVKGSEKARDPIMPVAAEKQREALDFLTKEILTDDHFNFDPGLLRRLTVEHWYHWGSSASFSQSTDYNVYDRVLGIQQIVLDHCLSPTVLRRLQNQQLLTDSENGLTLDEVFQKLTDSVWTELSKGEDGKATSVSPIRRNLQRDHLRRLCQIVNGSQLGSLLDVYAYAISVSSSSYPADAKSLARMHLSKLHNDLEKALETEELDVATRAHWDESRDTIHKVLNAEIQAASP